MEGRGGGLCFWRLGSLTRRARGWRKTAEAMWMQGSRVDRVREEGRRKKEEGEEEEVLVRGTGVKL